MIAAEKIQEIAESLQTIAENEQAVHEAGYDFGRTVGQGEGYMVGYDDGYKDGKAEGGGDSGSYDEGFEDGKKAHFNNVAHAIANSGNYLYGMAGKGWNDETFIPTEDIVLGKNPTGFFYNSGFTNLYSILEQRGVVLNTSKVEQFASFFQLSSVTEVPNLDLTEAKNAANMFNGVTNLRKIWGIIPPKATSCNVTNMFNGCSALEEITINGIIVVNGLDFSACTNLSKASFGSIVTALSTLSENLSLTVSKVAVNKAFETAEGLNDGEDSPEWNELVGSRYMWSIYIK